MDFNVILNSAGLYVGTYIVCVISGFVPVVNAELFLMIVSSTIEKNLFITILLLGTAGQMTAKSIMFYTGRGILHLSIEKYRAKMLEIRAKLESWRNRIDLFIFLSAFSGLPPFYVVALVAGTINIGFFRFFLAGFLGRFLRFGLAMLFPQFFKQIF